jgi:hypothetical protein
MFFGPSLSSDEALSVIMLEVCSWFTHVVEVMFLTIGNDFSLSLSLLFILIVILITFLSYDLSLTRLGVPLCAELLFLVGLIIDMGLSLSISLFCEILSSLFMSLFLGLDW